MSQAAQQYLKTQIMTASPEMLTLMLWDGAIRFAEQGKDAILKKDIEGSYHALLRAQKIMTELSTTLRHDLNPEVTKTLAALYTFIYRRLVDANLQKDPRFVDDALEIMRHQRETWTMVMDKASKEKHGDTAAPTAAVSRQTAMENRAAVATAPVIPQAPLPQAPMAPGGAAAPVRRQYPAFAVRPAAAVSSGISFEG